MKQQSLITRRKFIKGTLATAAVGAGAALFNFDFAGLRPLSAADSIDRKIFNNACPRNCYDTCSILSTVEDGVLKKVEGNPRNTYTRGRVCAKGFSYTRSVYSPDRIKYPMRQQGRGSGNWQRISWDEAYTAIANTILKLKKEYGSTLPVCLNKYSGNFDIMHYGIEGMLTSIGHTTRATGTPCWPAGIDAQTFDFGTIYNNDPEDMVNSRYLIVWGANPAWCSVHSMFFVKQAQEQGCKVVVIDPILSQTAAKADVYLQIKPSTDGALALGMARYILDNELYDGEWLARNSKGAEEFFGYLKNNITVEWAAQKTGIPQTVIERLAREYATAKPANIWIGYGMQRHTNGGQNVRAIDALAAMTGNIGKAGGGAQYAQLQTWGFNYYAMTQKKPVSGGQGDRNININNFGAEILNAKEPPVKMLWLACRSPLTQDPETAVVRQAFAAMDLIVTADLYMNPTVEMSDIVLPVTTAFEAPGVNVSYWHYWLCLNEQAIQPLYECKSDVTIAMELSAKLNELEPGSCTFPTTGNLEEWVSKEFNDNLYKQFGLNSWTDLKQGPAKAKSGLIAWQDGQFKTPSGKYEFWSDEAKKLGHHPLPVYVEEMQAGDKYPFRCISAHWKLNIHSQFQNLDWLAAVNNEPCLEISPQVAAKYSIRERDMVKMYNETGYITLPAKITETVPPDVVAVYEAWYKGKKFNVNYTVKAVPADMGKKATGMPGIAFHDNFVAIAKV